MKHLIASLIISVSIYVTLNATSHSEAFSIGDLSIRSNERGFQAINLSDYGKTGIIGNPELPSKVVNFIIPENQDASNLSVSASSTHLEGTYNIMPLQTAEYYNGDSSEFTEPNPAVYSCNQFYPQSYAEIVSQGYIDGANHIVSIRLNPIRYNPVSQVVEFVNNLYFSFSLSPSSSQPIYPVKRFAIDAPKYEAYLYNLVENTEDIVNYRNVPDIEIDPNGPEDFNYLIICPDDIELGENSPFAKFIQWKEQKGHRVRLMTYSQIANHIDAGNGDDTGTLIDDTPGKVRKYLKHHWQYHGLANVLLVGGMNDLELIRYAHNMGCFVEETVPIQNKYPSDVYFAEFQGSWNNDGDVFYGEFGNPSDGSLGPRDSVQFFQEIFIGRVILPPIVNPPSDSPTRQQAVLNWVDKVITYEKGPGSGFDGYLDKCYSLSASGINSSASSVLVNHGFDRLLVTDSFDDNDLRPLGNDVIAGINSFLPGIIVLSCHGNKGRMLIADNGIPNDGIGNYITSLNRYNVLSYLFGNETSNGLDNLNNPLKKYPIVLANSCNTGQYDYNIDNNEIQNPSMAEAFTSYTEGIGGPLWIGNSRPSYSGSFETVFVSNLFNPDVLTGYPEANPWCGGVSFASSRFTEGGNIDVMHARNYFGDPDMEIWTADPSKLNITLDYSGRSVVVKDESGALVENARVVFINETDKRIVYTDSNGYASTTINFSHVSVHRQNYVPDAIRIIQNHEVISSGSVQTLEINDRIYVPSNSTLELVGSLKLVHRSSIVSDGLLIIADNTDIIGSVSSSTSGDQELGNKITVNGDMIIGYNVEFKAATNMNWDGVHINSGAAILMQGVSFNRTPIELTNPFLLIDSCSFTLSPVQIVSGFVELNDSSITSSPLDIYGSNICVTACNLTSSDASLESTVVEYLNTSLTGSDTVCRNSEVSIIGGTYSNSHVDVTGKLIMESTTLTSTDDNNGLNNSFVVTTNSVVNVSNSVFIRSGITSNCLGLNQNVNSVNITDCTIQQNSSAGISLYNVPNYNLSGNTIIGNQGGITLVNCGTGANFTIENNIIMNNMLNGLYMSGSNTSIVGFNIIQENATGIVANNFCSWSLNGSYLEPYQKIQFNQRYQVLVVGNSTPDKVAYNWIRNSNHNYPWFRILQPVPNSRTLNVSNNYWGDNFDPQIDLMPTTAFIYEPIWIPGGLELVDDSAAASLFKIAYDHEAEAEFPEAIAAYKQIIEYFPSTEYAINAMKALLRIEDKKKDIDDSNLDYSALKAYYATEENIYLNAEYEYIAANLIARIDTRTQNYLDAIDFYESIISNPLSTVDSLCAVIDLGYVYLLMAEAKSNQGFVGKYPRFKPSCYNEWQENTLQILDEIEATFSIEENSIPDNVNIAQNYPNPFNPSTTISFSIPTVMMCSLDIYNIRGQKVRTLLNENKLAGRHSIVWDGKDTNGRSVSSGVYFYRLTTPNRTQTSKMLLMK